MKLSNPWEEGRPDAGSEWHLWSETGAYAVTFCALIIAVLQLLLLCIRQWRMRKEGRRATRMYRRLCQGAEKVLQN